ncbi:MAG: winged helix DNA-binding domain-containing protein [Ignavibacteria bacterium]|nr:winged helix DNA-binding domain-containing protein [Ignavibacteria bacterium]
MAESINLNEAKKIILKNQLLESVNKYNNKSELYQIIKKLGYIQIDTISVVERSHHHILWSRMPEYKSNMLSDLLEKDKLIFEYWSHAASYLPMTDYKYSLIRKNNFSKKNKTWGEANKKTIKMVYNRIKSDGPFQSKDFDDKKKGSSGWWNWKPSKDALDYLFHSGKLMISKRIGFQKVYELAERILPDSTDINIPSEKEFYKYLILNSISSFGISKQSEIMYLRKYDRKIFAKVIKILLDEKLIVEVKIFGFENDIYYSSILNLDQLNSEKNTNLIHILSPFDNFIIQRKRIKELFEFDFQIECYLPQSKRKYGYFCLPVIYGDKFIGRLDAKAHRSAKLFQINNFFPEDKISMKSNVLKSYFKKLEEMKSFVGCDEIKDLNK